MGKIAAKALSGVVLMTIVAGVGLLLSRRPVDMVTTADVPGYESDEQCQAPSSAKPQPQPAVIIPKGTHLRVNRVIDGKLWPCFEVKYESRSYYTTSEHLSQGSP